MKNVFITVVFFLSSVSYLFCQQTQLDYRITSMKQYDSDGRLMGEARLTYDEHGNLTSIINIDLSGKTLNSFELRYSDEGRLINRFNSCSMCGNNVAYQTYEYNSDGTLSKLNKSASFNLTRPVAYYCISELNKSQVIHSLHLIPNL